MAIIETSGLTKYYGKSRGIVDLDLSVAEGEMFGFIGPNGAGKSTTIRMLLGLISPTSGSGRVLGKDIVKKNRAILSEVGYMPSEATFYGDMKVRDVISLSADLHRKHCAEEAAQLCERLQLDTSKKIDALSLGNRKKVAIVCALQHRPNLYIFDEPTSGLDPLMQKEFFTLLHERQQEGATVFLSSHVLAEIQAHCQRAAIVREGRLIACDSVEKLSKTSARRVVLHGVSELPALDGIADVVKGDNTVAFLYPGKIPVLLDALRGLPLTDLTITEPTLDEVFLHYYSEGGAQI